MSTYKKHFWEWFKQHHQVLNDFQLLKTKPTKEIEYWLNELSAHLLAYSRFCSFCLEWEQKLAILTVTVNGKVKHFKRAEALVKTAPSIPGWTFKALEEPRPIDFALGNLIETTGIDPHEFYFEYLNPNPDNTALIIYHPLCVKENQHKVYRLAVDAVYNLLGERSFGLNISSVEVENLSSADPDVIQKLETLPETLSLLKPDMLIDENGNLVSTYSL